MRQASAAYSSWKVNSPQRLLAPFCGPVRCMMERMRQCLHKRAKVAEYVTDLALRQFCGVRYNQKLGRIQSQSNNYSVPHVSRIGFSSRGGMKGF